MLDEKGRECTITSGVEHVWVVAGHNHEEWEIPNKYATFQKCFIMSHDIFVSWDVLLKALYKLKKGVYPETVAEWVLDESNYDHDDYFDALEPLLTITPDSKTLYEQETNNQN